MMKKLSSAFAAILALSAVASAHATVTGPYVGGGLGLSTLNTPSNTLFDISQGLPGSSTSRDRDVLGSRLFAGYNFNQYFGVEANYIDFNRVTYNATTITNEPGQEGVVSNSSIRYSMHAFDVVGKAYLPLDDSGFDAYVLGGLAEVVSTVKFSDGGIPLSSDVSGYQAGSRTTHKIRPVYGIGVSYRINQHVSTNLEFTRIQGTGNLRTNSHATPRADLLSLNIAYNFS